MGPGPEVRERVLRVCQEAIAERVVAERRRGRRQLWALTLAAALLCLIHGVEERRHGSRMADLLAGSDRMAGDPRPIASLLGSLQARAAYFAALTEEHDGT